MARRRGAGVALTRRARLATLLALWVATAALVAWRYAPPAPRGLDAQADEVSGARAREALDALLEGVGPHPRGSDANAEVRRRLMAALEARGWAPRIQRAEGCGPRAGCAEVANVVARRAWWSEGELVLLSAHYDSVRAGPGASDDGVGVAALLEVARAIVDEAGAREVALLVTDGEEDGLLGARAFVAHHPLAARVRGIVNLDARGTSGPSIGFRMSRGGFPRAARFGLEAPRPVTNSVADTVFRLLPNDTDLSVFLEAGWAGMDFAFIGDVGRYHTAEDDLAHVSNATLQHHGDNALAAVRVMRDADLGAASDEVWTDLLASIVVSVPAWAMLPLAIAALALVIAFALWRRERFAWRGIALGAALSVGGPALTFAILLAGGLAAGFRPGFAPDPRPHVAGACAVAILITAGGAALARRFDAASLAAGAGLAAGLGGALLGVASPGASYPVVLHAVGLSATALGLALAPRAGWALALLTAAASAVLLFPFPSLLYDAVGDQGLPAVGAALALAIAPALPLVSGSPAASRSG